MATAVISPPSGAAARWTKQFCRMLPWTTAIPVIGPVSEQRNPIWIEHQTKAGIIAAFSRAAFAARDGGHIIYNAGHGIAAMPGTRSDTYINFMENAGSDTFRITLQGINHTTTQGTFEYISRGDPGFIAIGDQLKALKVAEVTLAVCSIGRDTYFMDVFKAAWGLTTLSAPMQLTNLIDDMNAFPAYPDITTYPRTRMYFNADRVYPPPLPVSPPPASVRPVTTPPVTPGVTPAPINSATVPDSWLELPRGLAHR